MLRWKERRAGSRHCPILGQGETLYGTRVLPGWYQGSAGARGDELPGALFRILMYQHSAKASREHIRESPAERRL